VIVKVMRILMTRIPVLILLFCGAIAAPVSGENLKSVLDRMDKGAELFQGMTAKLTQVNHTEVINENETLTAQVRMKRTKAGVVGRVDFTGPNQKIVSIRERELQVFYPKSNNVEFYDVGKFGDQLDQFLLLGFSTSGKEIQRNYNVRLIGTETIGGKVTSHLELTPKSKQAQEIFKKADLWLAQDANQPVQEKVHKNEQDYTLITYSDIKLNPPLSDKDLELILPPGVKKITPQK
jgi:outer membrane lipoprotein-sorting protein